MADNVPYTPGAGIDVAADDVGGVHYQRVKLSQGADGSATDVSSAAPLQVTLANTDANTNKLLVTPDLPSGASTAAKQDTGNTSLASIDGKITAVNTGAVVIASSAAIPVTDNAGSLTVDYATTGSGNATGALRVELANNGTGVLATVGAVTAITNALPAGSNAIGKLAANSGVDIGDVDVTTVGTITPGTAASSLGKAEDAAHSTGDVGVMALAVRSNTAASTSGTDGDYQPLITNTSGHLWVDASGQTLTVASHAVTNAGTFAVQATLAAGAAAIAKAEDVASGDGDVGVPALAVRKATPANTSGTDGDYEFLQMSAGRLWASATIDAALPAGTNAIGKLAANSGVDIGDIDVTSIVPGTGATNLGKAEDAVAGSGDTGVFVLGVANEAQSALAADGDYIAMGTDTKGNRLVVGNLANDAVDAGFPIKIGGQARTTNPTAVADADRVNAIFDKLGKQIVVGAIRDLKGVTQTQISNSTTETTIVAAVASTFCDVYGLVFANTGATTTKVTIKDSTAGTTRMIFEVPTLETRGFMVPVDSAVPQSGTNANWTATCASATTAMEVTALWVKNI